MHFLRTNLALVIGLALVALVGAFIYVDFFARSSAPATEGGDNAGSAGQAVIERIPVDAETGEEIPHPDLDRLFTPLASAPADIQAEARARVAEAVAVLKENQGLISAWLILAAYRKNAEDYAGAEEIWLYVTKRWPEEPTAFANLGDLYANYLPKYPQAESYFRAAITLKPDTILYYRALSDLYRNRYKTDTTLALDVLKEGLTANPKDIDLLISIAYYYREKGDMTNARAYFEQALAQAKAVGDTYRAAIIEEEMQHL